MKTVERKIIAELMKNSRRSDRELSHVIGVSQPTVSRTIAKLEKQGIIKEYTMIPDFRKLGYRLISLTFVNIKQDLTKEELEKAREITQHDMREFCPSEIIMFERGIGMGFGGVIVALHEDYSAYVRLKERTRKYDFLDHAKTSSFIINLEDDLHYRQLTFSTLAQHLLEIQKESHTRQKLR
ncbi:MAG: winged helix-turn-helix transcriptional regulator [Candidatus Bathyarchaeia archaeon]